MAVRKNGSKREEVLEEAVSEEEALQVLNEAEDARRQAFLNDYRALVKKYGFTLQASMQQTVVRVSQQQQMELGQ